MKVVRLVGSSDSGKTTLVESLVPRLTERDDRVATVKSIHHDVEIDTPGTDTYRHRAAGAETVVGITPELTFDVSTRGKRDLPPRPGNSSGRSNASSVDGIGPSSVERDPGVDDRERRALERTLDRLERRGYDTVVVEGFAELALPTIVVDDRTPSDVDGQILGYAEDGVDELVEAIRTLEGGRGANDGVGSETAFDYADS
ncbi:molybdopterin-guanine dinucleotide biosynthesis protein B [Natrarchaeobius sp. A-rgal3]|uniref:molybdopterin-guanine dinucleotide biosynthesis protein B n=1 Tax=Natrarchaeobius versutus TaxID=1679078 RepID=UPI0035109EF0